jgi:proline dehydrogenase
MMRAALIAMSQSRRLGGFMTSNRWAWSAARRFVAGQTIEEAVQVCAALNAAGLAATLDYLGENVTTQPEAEAACAAYVQALDRIAAAGIHSGLSLKLTALGLDLGDDLAAGLLRDILAHAAALRPARFVRIDMEGSAYTQRTLDIFYRVLAEHRNVGIVLQAYLHRSAADVEQAIAAGAGVRLCKGAYLEPPSIAFETKAEVDANFARLADRLLGEEARRQGVYPAIASHDEQVLAWVKRRVDEWGVPRDRFEFQMLYGIRRDLQNALVAEGYRLRVYVPYGRQWYPYFMRRLAERPENLGFVLRSVLRERRL